MFCAIIAATLLNAGAGGTELSIDAESKTIDPARSMFLTVSLKTPKGVVADLPDIRARARGFSLAEPFEEPPEELKDGSTVRTARWRLVPEPCAGEYKIAPFAVEPAGGEAFVAGPVRFDPPAERKKEEGPLQIDPRKDFPPLSWRLAGWCAALLAAAAAIVAMAILMLRYISRRIREHLMSPIERARVELDRLVKRGLPARGKYKDFYIELTMVVRRYVQRKYGVKAPHMTTDEFFAELAARGLAAAGSAELKEFLQSADLVKFAGLEATPEMADDATGSARKYLESDNGAQKQ